MNVLEVRNLSKAFGGVQALSGVSFAVAEGELLAMIGPNGAGKTTCFNLIHGQLRADAGEILLQTQRVGRTFQVATVFGSMSARENLQVVLLAQRRALRSFFRPMGSRHAAEADQLLEQVGMLDQAGRTCSTLAYGDLKRVELAIALAGEPRLLLMDEPTAGMAPAERDALMRLIARLAHSARIAVLFTEHDMDVVFAHADRIVVLAEGELIAEGPPAEVRGNARVREVYLGG
jgi:branched-chain amino acid transport system ATP-binding protein